MSELLETTSMLMERGGWVMIPLLGMSILGVALVIERSYFWFSVNATARSPYLIRLSAALRQGEIDEARSLSNNDRSPFGGMVRSMLDHGGTEAATVEAMELQRPRLERSMVLISTIVTAAPLLGILGTVVGIIQSFQLLGGESTLTDPTDVAGGIATALITTAFGLIIALMMLFPYMIFRGLLDRTMGRMESIAAAAIQGSDHGGS